MVSSGISLVAFASVLLGENPSEEVDDIIIKNLSQEMTFLVGTRTSAMKQRQEKWW